jgi:hypothetical protein
MLGSTDTEGTEEHRHAVQSSNIAAVQFAALIAPYPLFTNKIRLDRVQAEDLVLGL